MAKSTFFTELKRRQIYRGGVMYVVAGWVVVQVATQVFPFFSIPVWAIRFVVVAILLGFPLLLVWLWMFESSLPEGEDRLVDRRGGDRGGDSTEALARIMEVERNERQKENQVLIAALAQLKGAHGQPAESPADAIAALQGRRGHTVVPETGHTPPAEPYTPPAPAKRKSRTRMLMTVLAIFIVLAGLWTLLVPQASVQPATATAAAATGQLAEKYVAPGFAQVEDFGVKLLRPVLAKLGLHIAPERVFTGLMVLLALVLLRDFYRKITRPRSRRAPSH